MNARKRSTVHATPALALGVTLALTSTAALACHPPGREAGAESAQPAAGAEAAQVAPSAAAAGAVEAQTWLDDFTIGHQVDTEGAIPLAQQGDDFTPGQTVYVAMEVGDAPAGASVHVRFEEKSGRTVAEDEKKVPVGTKYLYFDSGDTSSWKAGDYRAEIRSTAGASTTSTSS